MVRILKNIRLSNGKPSVPARAVVSPTLSLHAGQLLWKPINEPGRPRRSYTIYQTTASQLQLKMCFAKKTRESESER